MTTPASVKSYASRAAGMICALNEVIASLKTSDHAWSRANTSNTGAPNTFSTAGLPVLTDSISSAYTRRWFGSERKRARAYGVPGASERIIADTGVGPNVRGDDS